MGSSAGRLLEEEAQTIRLHRLAAYLLEGIEQSNRLTDHYNRQQPLRIEYCPLVHYASSARWLMVLC